MVHEHIRSEVSAFHKSLCSENGDGANDRGFTVTPLSDGKDTPGKCRDILS